MYTFLWLLVLVSLSVWTLLYVGPPLSLREEFERLPDDPKPENALPPLEHWLKEPEEAKDRRIAPQ